MEVVPGRVVALQRRLTHPGLIPPAICARAVNGYPVLKTPFIPTASFLITTIPPILRNLPLASLRDGTSVKIIARIQIVLMPLQGFFNALIFMYHKIYNYRRIHPDVSRCHVLMLVFTGKADDHVLFSRISMVSVNGESIDINIHNERNEDILLFMDRSGRLEYEQEEDFGSFDEEVFVDDNEESLGDLSGFSSLPSNGVSLEIDKDSNVIDGDLKESSDSVVSWFSRSGNKKVPAGNPTTVPSS